MRIEDGKGTGYLAQVSSSNRLLTSSATYTEVHNNAHLHGEVYYFSTGAFISLTTTGAPSGVFYLKNTSTTKSLIIDQIRTCGNQIQKVVIYSNPTGGTLISTANAGSAANSNLTSSNSAEATVYYGADALTVTGGTHLAQHINNIGHSTMDMQGTLILGRNDSIAITFEVASAASVCVTVLGYFE